MRRNSVNSRRFNLIVLVACALLAFTSTVFAHNPSKSYLSITLESNQLTGQWDIPLRDLAAVLPLNPDTNGLVSPESLATNSMVVTAYAFTRLKLNVDGQAAVTHPATADFSVAEFADGPYIQIPFTIDADSSPQAIEINYQLFFDVNSLHRGLLRLEANGKTQSAVFTPEQPQQIFSLAIADSRRQFFAFLQEGIWHIWTGYDHILFLVALLLPAVVRRDQKAWQPVPALRPAFINVLKIVTAFTVAHSLTLTLAALEIVRIPSRITESAIAASVALAAANNLWPLVRERGWIVAFGFGLIHGFGFATALADLGLVRHALALTLVGFNLGVEIGQLAIVLVFLPIAFSLRQTKFYKNVCLRGGSVVIVLIAALWFAERVGDFKVLPF